jgi:hypothetical protein
MIVLRFLLTFKCQIFLPFNKRSQINYELLNSISHKLLTENCLEVILL